jgi:hypothetical protein
MPLRALPPQGSASAISPPAHKNAGLVYRILLRIQENKEDNKQKDPPGGGLQNASSLLDGYTKFLANDTSRHIAHEVKLRFMHFLGRRDNLDLQNVRRTDREYLLNAYPGKRGANGKGGTGLLAVLARQNQPFERGSCLAFPHLNAGTRLDLAQKFFLDHVLENVAQW